MGTQRATGRAGDHPTTRWLLGTPALLVLCLVLTGCDSLQDTGPEVIRYCAESVQSPLSDAASSCIPRP
jgi:hypothetical protein